MNINNFKGVHPGIILGQELKKRNLDLHLFALSVNELPQKLDAIIKGRQKINIELSLKIERLLLMEEGCFMIIQVYYDIAKFKKEERDKKSLKQEKKQDYLNRLEKDFTEKKLFLRKNLGIHDVSKETDIPVHNISNVINSEYNFSFWDFVNLKRMQYFIEKLNEPEFQNLSLRELSFRCGFNSRTTLFRVFIKHTGKSPTQYVSELPNFIPNKSKYARKHRDL